MAAMNKFGWKNSVLCPVLHSARQIRLQLITWVSITTLIYRYVTHVIWIEMHKRPQNNNDKLIKWSESWVADKL